MKKLSKFGFCLSLLMAVTTVATSCGGKKDDRSPEEKLGEAVGLLVYDGLDSVVADFPLITSFSDIPDVTISYTATTEQGEASDYLSISEDGKTAVVNRPAIGEFENGYAFAFLNATLKCQEITSSKRFNVKVLEAGSTVTAAEFNALTSEDASSGKVVSYKGVVLTIGSGCAVVGDHTGYVFVYSSSAISDDLKVGDYVQIDGSVSFYNNAAQFSYSAKVPPTVTILETGPSIPKKTYTLETWTGADLDTYHGYNKPADLFGHYVSVTGLLTIDGKYYNITVDGTSVSSGAAICYPNDADKVKLAEYDGTTINITGYTLYNSHDYCNIAIDSLKQVTVSDDEKLTTAVSALSILSETAASFTLPATGSYGTTITWESDNTSVIAIGALDAENNSYAATVTTSDSQEYTVKLTAHITLDASHKADKEFNVKVLKTVQYAHAGTASDPYSVVDVNKRASLLQPGDSTNEEIYTKGIISSIKYAVDAGYGNVSFYISDDGSTESQQFYVYRCKGLNGESLTSEDQVKVGDQVVVYGTLTNYNGTLEYNQGCKFYSSSNAALSGSSTPTPTPTPGTDTPSSGTDTPVDSNLTSVKYDFSSLTEKGNLISDANALSVINGAYDGEGTSPLTAVEANTVYNGNGNGGAYPTTAGLLKFSTSSLAGSLKLTFGTKKVVKVDILCHDWYKDTNNGYSNEATVSVNGGTAQNAPYTTTPTPATLSFSISASSDVTIATGPASSGKTTGRIFVFSITVYFAE